MAYTELGVLLSAIARIEGALQCREDEIRAIDDLLLMYQYEETLAEESKIPNKKSTYVSPFDDDQRLDETQSLNHGSGEDSPYTTSSSMQALVEDKMQLEQVTARLRSHDLPKAKQKLTRFFDRVRKRLEVEVKNLTIDELQHQVLALRERNDRLEREIEDVKRALREG